MQFGPEPGGGFGKNHDGLIRHGTPQILKENKVGGAKFLCIFGDTILTRPKIGGSNTVKTSLVDGMA